MQQHTRYALGDQVETTQCRISEVCSSITEYAGQIGWIVDIELPPSEDEGLLYHVRMVDRDQPLILYYDEIEPRAASDLDWLIMVATGGLTWTL